MTDQPDDQCRTLDVDGEAVTIRGSEDFTDQDRVYLAEIVRAARRMHEENTRRA